MHAYTSTSHSQVNTLLKLALEALGFVGVRPMLCRVRWNKPRDVFLAPSHVVLVVPTADGARYLADVGFAGQGPPTPVRLDTTEPQEFPAAGRFRVVPYDRAGCTSVLEKESRGGGGGGDCGGGGGGVRCCIVRTQT